MKQDAFYNATVVKHTGERYSITFLPQWAPREAVLRGKFRLKGNSLTNPLAVGDLVDGFWEGQQAIITHIHPRKNYLIRKSTNLSRQAHIIAANIDCAYLVLSATEPQTPYPFIDRFLVTCRAYRVPVTLVLNKIDEWDMVPQYKELAQEIEDIYTRAGYEILPLSAQTGQGMEGLQERLQGRISLFSGLSGVGKTSLINRMDPTLGLKTGHLSMAHLTGRHTTTFYQMHPLPRGGFLIDSPGIKGFGLIDIDKYELYHYFPEIFAAAHECKYNPCLHLNEPHCAVKAAVEDGRIAPQRYESYLKLVEDPEGSKYRT